MQTKKPTAYFGNEPGDGENKNDNDKNDDKDKHNHKDYHKVQHKDEISLVSVLLSTHLDKFFLNKPLGRLSLYVAHNIIALSPTAPRGAKSAHIKGGQKKNKAAWNFEML